MLVALSAYTSKTVIDRVMYPKLLTHDDYRHGNQYTTSSVFSNIAPEYDVRSKIKPLWWGVRDLWGNWSVTDSMTSRAGGPFVAGILFAFISPPFDLVLSDLSIVGVTISNVNAPLLTCVTY